MESPILLSIQCFKRYLLLLFRGGGGGGGDMRINENSPRKWPKTHSQKLFLRINENSLRKWPKTHSQKLFISLFRIMSSVKKERDIAID